MNNSSISQGFRSGGFRSGKKTGASYILIRLVLFLSCALLGFLAISQYKSLQKTPGEKFIEGKSIDELSSDYIILYNKNIVLSERNIQLTDNISNLESAKNKEDVLMTILQDEASSAKRLAGFGRASGKGISVVISPDEEAPITSNMLIQFINEIKSADAAAIAINDQRIVAMTEIRDTASGFSINGEMFSYEKPITILAIGNGVDMYSALQMVGGVLDKWNQSHIDVHVDIVDNLTVPVLGEKQQQKMDLSAFSIDAGINSPTPTDSGR